MARVIHYVIDSLANFYVVCVRVPVIKLSGLPEFPQDFLNVDPVATPGGVRVWAGVGVGIWGPSLEEDWPVRATS